jgi:hypothetical protein
VEGGAWAEEVGEWAICCQVMDEWMVRWVMLLAFVQLSSGVDMCAAPPLHLYVLIPS